MKNKKDSLGDRMKGYEAVSKTRLVRRMPVVLRLDGKAFHSFTKGFRKPFDTVLAGAMQQTMKRLCENIQGCVFGYTQSDEITLVLVDYKKINSSAWFDNEVQKMCSVAASMTTFYFNQEFSNLANLFEQEVNRIVENDGEIEVVAPLDSIKPYEALKLVDRYAAAIQKGAMFDCRAFNVPIEDTVNCVYWRQEDCTRNSIEAMGQANFSHKELMNKSCNMIQDMLHEQKGINWNDLPIYLKRGTACTKQPVTTSFTDVMTGKDIVTERTGWVLDLEMPILRGEDREYLEKLIKYPNE